MQLQGVINGLLFRPAYRQILQKMSFSSCTECVYSPIVCMDSTILPGLFEVEVVVAKLRKVDILVRHDN